MTVTMTTTITPTIAPTAHGALDWATDGRDWPNRASSRFVEAAGLAWHVQQMGRGPLLLLIHGTGSSTHSWRDLMPRLAGEFECVAIDLPGHAFTRAPGGTLPPGRHLSLRGMAGGIAALLKTMRCAPAHIVGHSAGAAIAAQLCLVEGLTVDSIVALNGAFFPLPGLQGLVFPGLARLLSTNSLAPRWFARHASDPSSVRRLIAQTGSRLDQRGEALYARLVRNPQHVAAALGMMARWDVARLAGRLPRLGPKLHLIAGSNDRVVPPGQSRRVCAAVEGAVFAPLGKAGHLAHEERPEEVARLLQQWCAAGQASA